MNPTALCFWMITLGLIGAGSPLVHLAHAQGGHDGAVAPDVAEEHDGPPNVVLGVPPKFPVTPAVEKAVHDIDEVMQWFMSRRAAGYMTPSHTAPSVHLQLDRVHRAFDTLVEEARRNPAMLEAVRKFEGVDRHAKFMLMGLDRAEHLEEYEWVRDVLFYGDPPDPGVANVSRQIDGLAAREFFREQPRRRYLAEYFVMGIFMPHRDAEELWVSPVSDAFRDHPDPRSVILFAYLVECADTEYPALWIETLYPGWRYMLRPPVVPDADNPFDAAGPLFLIEVPEEIAAIRDHINEHAKPLRDIKYLSSEDILRYPPEKFMELEQEGGR